MTTRNAIIDAIRRNRPERVPLPDVPSFETPADSLVEHFTESLQGAGGAVLPASDDHVAESIRRTYPQARKIASTVPGEFAGTVSLDEMARPHEAATVELLVCRGRIGVAENGAVWLSAADMGLRAAPFCAEHLVILLDRERIVWNMHQAYEQIAVDAAGFGVFVSGPSKTADIEQSLVIGAHGPRSCTVVLT